MLILVTDKDGHREVANVYKIEDHPRRPGSISNRVLLFAYESDINPSTIDLNITRVELLPEDVQS